jgi:hypothetical protein
MPIISFSFRDICGNLVTCLFDHFAPKYSIVLDGLKILFSMFKGHPACLNHFFNLKTSILSLFLDLSHTIISSMCPHAILAVFRIFLTIELHNICATNGAKDIPKGNTLNW